jgi:PAS domain S-box-containing protein
LKREDKGLGASKAIHVRGLDFTQMDTILTTIPDGIIIVNKQGTILFANPAFENLTGYSMPELIGRNMKDLVSTDQENAAFTNLAEKINQGEMGSGHFITKKKNGETVDIQASISPCCNKNGELIGYVLCERDITAELKMEKQLRESQKLEAIATLAGGIAHDFNNILMAIIGYTDITLDKFKDNEEISSNLTNVLKASYRARDLVKQILTFSRQHEEQKQPLNLKVLVKETLKFLRASLPSSINITHHIETEVHYILADYTQCYQALMNLCTNAAQAMPENDGNIEISLCNVELDAQFLRIYAGMNPGSYVKLTVSDTGCGIDPELKDKIFEPYFTTKTQNKGSGLGLSVVHGIVQNYHGLITVSSEVGKGSTFSLYFPALAEAKIEKETTIAPPMGSERILFIDDEEILAELGGRMLASLGYQVTSKTNSKEALEYFKDYPDQFDLIITDMTMPQISGDKLAAALLSIRPDIPIILCTGYHEKISETQVKALGIKAFLSKPLIMNELGGIIRKVLDKEIK